MERYQHQPFLDMLRFVLILAGSFASKEENRDAMDLAVIQGLEDRKLFDQYQQTAFVPLDPMGKRTQGTAVGPDGTWVEF